MSGTAAPLATPSLSATCSLLTWSGSGLGSGLGLGLGLGLGVGLGSGFVQRVDRLRGVGEAGEQAGQLGGERGKRGHHGQLPAAHGQRGVALRVVGALGRVRGRGRGRANTSVLEA